MLPIFRMISVGGVLLAIVILALALSPPGGSHRQFASLPAPARGVLIDLGEHPERRKFLILAAVRRAGELERLRELPDTPVRLPDIPELAPVDLPLNPPKDTPAIAGLPVDRVDADPDDETGSINVLPAATIPIEIGEPSSTELPVMPAEEEPPAAALPERIEPPETIKSPDQPVRRSFQNHRTRVPAQARAEAAAHTEAPIPFNLLKEFFDSLLGNKPASAAKSSIARTNSAKRPLRPKRPAAIRSVSQ